jgi:hypothetical protein
MLSEARGKRRERKGDLLEATSVSPVSEATRPPHRDTIFI